MLGNQMSVDVKQSQVVHDQQQQQGQYYAEYNA
jgi:hypothetical protein